MITQETEAIIQTKEDENSASPRKDRKKNAATGASAAGARAIGSQAIAFYFRAPVKAFFRTRVDYMAFARAINPRVQAQEGWSLRMSTPGLLAHAVRQRGWQFIPNYVLPPMFANIGIGAVLYSSYLHILGTLHRPSSQSLKRVYPPPPIHSTLFAGFSAGAIQSVIAAPLDALSVQYKTSEVLSGRYATMWHYTRAKLLKIGFRGVFAGWGLVFLKDSLGYAVFFATFEYIKAQACQSFVTNYYGSLKGRSFNLSESKHGHPEPDRSIKVHYSVEPAFLMLGGIGASICQQGVQHPLNIVQRMHYMTLDLLKRELDVGQTRIAILRKYAKAYETTFQKCLIHARRAGGWKKWLYRGFLGNTLKQMPSTSAGLIVFELVRRRYGIETEPVEIEKDGYKILLP